MVTMVAAIAEFERGISLERQREGVAKTKADGKKTRDESRRPVPRPLR
jgi:DNA invertase Pin-like site-specific DNA recombinase